MVAKTIDFLDVPKKDWQGFFDRISKALGGKTVEIEVIGIDLGDQIEAEWLPLSGITYDPKEDTLFVYSDSEGDELDHAIEHPHRIYVQMGTTGLSQVVVLAADDHREFIRLRAPLTLSASV